MSQLKQIATVQYLRGIASVAVVLYHISLWEMKALGARSVVPAFFSIGEAGVDMFFVISGFIMVFIQASPLSSGSAYGRFLFHRFSRVYPPVWIVMILLVPIWIKRPELFNNYHGNRVDLARSFLLLPQDYFPLLGVAWTLIHEVYFYFVVSLALCFTNRGRWIFGGAWFAVVLIVFCWWAHTRFNGNRVVELVFSPFSLTFLLGYFTGLSYLRITRLPGSLLASIFLAGLAGLIVGFECVPPVGVYPENNHLSRLIAYGIPSCLLLVAGVGFDSRLRGRVRTLTFLGDASYAIYLVHLPILAAFYNVVKRFQPGNLYLIGGLALTSLLACLTGGAIFNRLVERRVMRASRNLIDKVFPSVPQQ